MKDIHIPYEPNLIIRTLSENGYEAYIVGGCVRDSLLGREASDYDITTSAKPDDIKRIFKRTVDTGIAHGTVTVLENDKPYEVTTFRQDGEYKDNRRPVSVSYTNSIIDDLARRDFTVNAMAYNEEAGLVDAFLGLCDLKNRLIRCVGDANKRFEEDALRVLRGIRFSSVLDFDIEKNTREAILNNGKRLANISRERIFAEWKKLLSGPRAYEVICEYLEVIEVFLPELKGVKMPDKSCFDRADYDERQIMLFALSSGADGFESAAKSLKMDSKTRDMGISVLKILGEFPSKSSFDPRKFIVGKSDELSLKTIKCASLVGLIGEQTLKQTQDLISSNAPRAISQLAIGGAELISLGLKGEAVGKALQELIYLVALGEARNEKKCLIDIAIKRYLK